MLRRRTGVLKATVGALSLCFAFATFYCLQWLPINVNNLFPGGRSLRHVHLAKDIIRVLMVAESSSLAGTIATMNSVSKNTEAPVHFYLVTDNTTAHYLWSWIESTDLRYTSYEICIFNEDYLLGKEVPEFTAERPLLYAKIFFGRIISNNTARIVYLSSDVILLGDIKELANVSINNDAVGAFSKKCDPNDTSREMRAAAGLSMNQYEGHMNVRSSFLSEMGIDITECIFDTDVFVIDMHQWKSQKMEEVIVNLIAHNNRERIYLNEGPLGPMLIALYNKVTPLPSEWHVRHLGFTHYTRREKDLKVSSAKLLHWDGPFKPWLLRTPYSYIWEKYYIPDPQGRFRMEITKEKKNEDIITSDFESKTLSQEKGELHDNSY